MCETCRPLQPLTAPLLICVTLPTSGLPTCYNLSHYILRLHCLAPSHVHPNIGSVLDHPSGPPNPMQSLIFIPWMQPYVKKVLLEAVSAMCLSYPLLNWLGFHSNGSHRDQVCVCYNMTSFLRLIYSSGGSNFLKSSIKANEKWGSLEHTSWRAFLRFVKMKKENRRDTYFKFVLIWNPMLAPPNPVTQTGVEIHPPCRAPDCRC